MKSTKKKPPEKNFFNDVFEVVKLIPKGRITSYGAIAHYLGTRMSARMVGWAMNAVPDQGSYAKIPAHRVVNSQGLLTGKHHFKPPNTMKKLLEKDGIKVTGDKIVHFKELYWNPSKELL